MKRELEDVTFVNLQSALLDFNEEEIIFEATEDLVDESKEDIYSLDELFREDFSDIKDFVDEQEEKAFLSAIQDVVDFDDLDKKSQIQWEDVEDIGKVSEWDRSNIQPVEWTDDEIFQLRYGMLTYALCLIKEKRGHEEGQRGREAFDWLMDKPMDEAFSALTCCKACGFDLQNIQQYIWDFNAENDYLFTR